MTKWAYVLVGNDRTGKTTFQKMILEHITGSYIDPLHCNLVFDLAAMRSGSRNTHNISLMSRSYQEQKKEYVSIGNFFASFFKDADIAILSSHLYQQDIKEMIHELKKRFFNVAGVFFENSIAKDSEKNSEIALLEWDERNFIMNPITESKNIYKQYLRKSGAEFTYQILNKN